MNKEQFRKELEDCWDASNDSFWWHTVANNDRPEPPDKSTYITIRLAALGDELVYTPIEPLDPTLPQATSKRADDGQEGKGLDSKKILQNTLNGAWEEIRRLRALLETDSTGNELLRSIYQICERKGENTNWEAITKKIQERLAALPVADRDNSDSTINKTTMINISEDDFKKDFEQIAELSRVYRFDNAETWFKDRKMWIDARLAAYLPSGDIEKNYDPTYESETSQSEKDIKELQKNKTPVGDGEGEKVGNVKELPEIKALDVAINNLVHGLPTDSPDAFKEIQKLFWNIIDPINRLLPAAVTGGGFVWTDDIVEEFAKQYRFSSSRISIEMFKSGNCFPYPSEGQPAQGKE